MSNNRLNIGEDDNNTFLRLINENNTNEILLKSNGESQMNALDLMGDLKINGDKFVVEASTGNVTINGNLNVNGNINGDNPSKITHFSYSPKLLYGSPDEPVEATNTAYNISNGSGFIISKDGDTYCHLNIDILLSNKGTGISNGDASYITMPPDLPATTDRQWISTFEPLQVDEFDFPSTAPFRYPVAIIDATNNLIALTKASPNINNPQFIVTFGLIRNISRFGLSIFYKVDNS